MNRFYYMRHGQVDANLESRLCGGDWQDIPLNEKGVAQVKTRQSIITKLTNIHTICISPTLRTIQTADIVAAALKVERVVIEDLREWKLGTWDRKNYDEVIPPGTSLMDHDPPGGETRKQFEERIARAFGLCSQKSNDVLIISHGAVWRALISLLGLDDAWCENAALFEVRLQENRGITELTPP